MTPVPKNIYGVTKKAAEDLCEPFNTKFSLPCLVLRTSRFFANEDDDKNLRRTYADQNAKVNEYLYRRSTSADVVTAHQQALERAPAIGFGRYIISAKTPFTREHTATLREDAPSVLRKLFPAYETEYGRRGWKMFTSIDRIYVDTLARQELVGARTGRSRMCSTVSQRTKIHEAPSHEALGSKGIIQVGPSRNCTRRNEGVSTKTRANECNRLEIATGGAPYNKRMQQARDPDKCVLGLGISASLMRSVIRHLSLVSVPVGLVAESNNETLDRPQRRSDWPSASDGNEAGRACRGSGSGSRFRSVGC